MQSSFHTNRSPIQQAYCLFLSCRFIISVVMVGLLLLSNAASAQTASDWKKYQVELQKYQQSFSRAAVKAINAKLAKANQRQIALWQQTAQTARQGELTKEIIAEKVKPAYNNILAAAWIQPQEILDSNTALTADREKILQQADIWEKFVIQPSLKSTSWNTSAAPTLTQFLEQTEFDAVLYSLPLSAKGKLTAKNNRQLTFTLDIEETRCISATNRYRILLGLEPQVIDKKLCAVSRDHSHDMKTKNFFAHESPVEGKKTFTDRANRMGAKGAGSENIFMGSEDGFAAAEAWFDSPGHHKNMFNKNERIAVGRFDNYFTQMTGW